MIHHNCLSVCRNSTRNHTTQTVPIIMNPPFKCRYKSFTESWPFRLVFAGVMLAAWMALYFLTP